MEWVEITALRLEGHELCFPEFIVSGKERTMTLIFGERKAEITAVPFCARRSNAKKTLQLCLSQRLIDELLIPTNITYRLKVEGSKLILGPVIGLLLGRQCLYYNDRNMAEYTDAMCGYKDIGGLVFAFTPEGIDFGNRTIHGLYYNGGAWDYKKLPFPSVIFRRGFQSNEKAVKKIKAVLGDIVFNSVRWDKWKIHHLLSNDKSLCQYLPETYAINGYETIKEQLDKYEAVILKPANLSRGRGIFIVNRAKNGFMVTDCQKKEQTNSIIMESQFSDFLQSGGFYRHNYIVQNRVDLACVNGSPFDIRVVMHKNASGEWQCSGIECRIAGVERLISNIAQGGRALSVSRTLLLAFGPHIDSKAIKREIVALSKDICRCMERNGDWFAELGLDIAIDGNRRLWFIEANTRPSFKGFKLMDPKNYLYICSRPIAYAAAFAGFNARGCP